MPSYDAFISYSSADLPLAQGRWGEERTPTSLGIDPSLVGARKLTQTYARSLR